MRLQRRTLQALAVLLLALAAAAAMPALGLTPRQAVTVGLLVGTIGLWATAAIPEPVTALAFMGLALVLGAGPPETVFAGFASPALWLVAGGLLLAASTHATGLGRRLAAVAGRRLGHSYAAAVGGVAVLAMGFAFIVPAAFGRVVIIVPLVQAMALALGLGRHRAGHHGLIAAAVLGTMAPGFAILTANLPNLVLAGAAEGLYGEQFGYGSYLLWHFPVLGLLKLPVIVLAVLRLFPDRIDGEDGIDEPGPWTAAEHRLLLLILATVALWATDRLHGLPAGGLALLAGVLCLLPRIGFLDPARLGADLNVGTLFYVAGVLGLVRLVDASGLDALAASHLLPVALLQGASPGLVYAAVVGAGALLATVAGFPVAAAVLVPMAAPIAEAAGVPLIGVLMAIVAVFSFIVLPHQEAPVAVGIHLGGIPRGPAIRLLLITAAVFGFVLTPLHFLWLGLMGLFG
ncbi:anion permease [Geminicoccaceae bacterium 1502E]|nr:anion permease [Geminicoccaceae bacterium 1502E]